MRVLELFGGIGACTKALKRLGINPTVVDYVEIDKYAVASYNAINGTSFQPQDICEWDKNIEVDLIMHGSPCTDFSIAGLQAGGDENSGTRSSLMYESVRIIKKLMPKYVVWENVKNVISKRHRHNFDKYLDTLEELGYKNFYQVLNAKDYGIPQNRERVFVISILGDEEFLFPKKQELKLRLKDILQDEVDEKFYLSEQSYKNLKLKINLQDFAKTSIQRVDVPQVVSVRKYDVNKEKLVNTLRANKSSLQLTNSQIAKHLNVPITKVEHWFRTDDCFSIPNTEIWFELKKILEIETDEFDESIMTFEEREGVYEKANRCYHENGLAPTITSAGADEKIIVSETVAPSIIKVGQIESSFEQSGRIYDPNGIAPTIMSNSHGKTTGGYIPPKIIVEKQLAHEISHVCEPRLEFIGGLGDKDWAKDGKKLSRNYPQGSRIYSSNGIASALTSQGVGGVGDTVDCMP